VGFEYLLIARHGRVDDPEDPSLSTSGETLTIGESVNLEGGIGARRNVGGEHEWSRG
jgi:hypothetical protein